VQALISASSGYQWHYARIVILRIQHLGKCSEKEMTVIEASSPSTTDGYLWQIFFNPDYALGFVMKGLIARK